MKKRGFLLVVGLLLFSGCASQSSSDTQTVEESATNKSKTTQNKDGTKHANKIIRKETLFVYSGNLGQGLVDKDLNIILPDSAETQFISQQGDFFIATNYDNEHSLIFNQKGEKVTETSSRGVWIIDANHYAVSNEETSDIYDFSGNHLASVSGAGRFWGDENQLLLFFSENERKATILNDDLSIRTGITADQVSTGFFVDSEAKNYFSYCVNEQWGLMDENGKVIIEPKYDYLSSPDIEGRIGYRLNETGGIMNLKQEVLFSQALSSEGQIYPCWPTSSGKFIYSYIHSVDDNGGTLYSYELWDENGILSTDITSVNQGTIAKNDRILNYDGIELGRNPQSIFTIFTSPLDTTKLLFKGENGMTKLIDKESGEVLKERDLTNVTQ